MKTQRILALAALVACVAACGPGERTPGERSTPGPTDGGTGTQPDGGTGTQPDGGSEPVDPFPHVVLCLGDATPETAPEHCSAGDQVPPLDFGLVERGVQVRQDVRVFNRGGALLKLRRVSLVPSASEFSLLRGGADIDVPPGESALISIALTATSEGEKSAQLLVPSNDQDAPILQLVLSARAGEAKLCLEPQGAMTFGGVVVGQSSTQTLRITNCGAFDLTLLSVSLEEGDGTPGDFRLLQPPVVPRTLPAGEVLPVNVGYLPRGVRNDWGTLRVETDRTDVGVPLTGNGLAACSTDVPSAAVKVLSNGQVIDPATKTVKTSDTVTVDGSNSWVPQGGASYQWTIVQQPPGATGAIVGSGATPQLRLPLGGSYTVQLVVADGRGCASAPTQVTIRVQAPPKISVQLTWAEGYGDLDLHYVGPGGAFYQGPGTSGPAGDTYYANKHPNWGANNSVGPDGTSANDPQLELDDLWGNGPEIIVHDQPFAGTFKVVVHYYCSRAYSGTSYSSVSSGPATATVRVFVDGVLALEQTHQLRQRDVWEAAILTVTASGASAQVRADPSTAPLTRSLWVGSTGGENQSCTADTN